jgi:hypothetical protein
MGRHVAPGGNQTARVYPSGIKRELGKRMCHNCLLGHASRCFTDGCSCCCNDICRKPQLSAAGRPARRTL